MRVANKKVTYMMMRETQPPQWVRTVSSPCKLKAGKGAPNMSKVSNILGRPIFVIFWVGSFYFFLGGILQYSITIFNITAA